MSDGSRFANKDPRYLREVQYRDSAQWDAVVAAVSAFAGGAGTMRITRDTGLFVCRNP